MKKSIKEQYKGLSFAEASKKIKEKYKKSDSDLVEKESLKVELNELEKLQEELRLQDHVKETMNQYMKGGKMKYENGGTIKDVNGNPITINNMGIGKISYPNTWSTSDVLQPLPQLPIQQFGMMGSEKPFAGQVDTLSSNIGDSVYEVPGSNKFSTPQDAPVESGNRNGMSAYAPALIGQGLSTLLNAGILAQGYDKVNPVDNPYEEDVKRLMQERGIDTTQQRNQILSAYNAGRQNLNNVRSSNIRNALDANLMGITQDNLAESKLQEQVANQGFRADLANSLNSLGGQKVQAQNYSDQLNNQSKSNWQGGVSELGKQLADIGLSQTTLKLNNVQQTAIANIMSQKYPDFVIGNEALKSYLNGTYTDAEFVKLKEAATKNPELQSVVDFATYQKQQKENKEQ